MSHQSAHATDKNHDLDITNVCTIFSFYTSDFTTSSQRSLIARPGKMNFVEKWTLSFSEGFNCHIYSPLAIEKFSFYTWGFSVWYNVEKYSLVGLENFAYILLSLGAAKWLPRNLIITFPYKSIQNSQNSIHDCIFHVLQSNVTKPRSFTLNLRYSFQLC